MSGPAAAERLVRAGSRPGGGGSAARPSVAAAGRDSAGPDQAGVQRLRGLAATAVLIHHTLEESNGAASRFSPDWVTAWGACGVDVFFVISGFIMVYTSFRTDSRPATPLRFLRRRATRIYPLYWVCCAVMLAAMAGGALRAHPLSGAQIAAALALAPVDKPILNVSWTLVYEVYFYLAFAITLRLRSAVAACLATAGLLLALGVGSAGLSPGILRSFLANPIVVEFCAGQWLAMAFLAVRARRARWPVPSLVAAGAFLAMGLAAIVLPHPTTNGLQGWARLAGWGAPAALAVAAALGAPAARGLAARLLGRLGDASYSIYLTHPFVMLAYAAVLRRTPLHDMPQHAAAPLVVLAALLVGAATHAWIESPLLRWMRGRA